MPYERAGELVVLRHRDMRTGLTKPDLALGDFLDLRARQRTLEALAGFSGFQSMFLSGNEARRVEGAIVTPDALETLRLTPALGRLLRPEDARHGSPPVALVSHEFWRMQLGSDPKALSRSIQLGTTRTMVVGVLPSGFRFPGMTRTEVIVPLTFPEATPAQRRSGWIYGLGRLRSGQTTDRAEAEIAALSRQLETEHPEQNRGSRYEVLSLRDAFVGETRRPLLLLLAAVSFVLLMACANVGNLMLARGLGRQRELAVRLALGASRRRLAAQLIGEALALALAGGIIALIVAWRAVPLLAALIPNASIVPGLEQAGANTGVLLFAFVASVASALTSAAVACAGLLRRDDHAVAPERHATMAPRARLAASGLVVAQIALAMVLLAGAGLTLRSFNKLLAVDPGFTTAGVLTLQLALPEGRYEEDGARRAFYDRAFEAIEGLAGVKAVGAAMVTPLTGNNWTAPLRRLDRPLPPGQRPPEVGWQLASRGYLQALQIPLRAGRLFDERDATGAPVVIVSEAVAARFFAGEQVLGHRIDLGDVKPEIVGIVGNIRRASLVDDPRADLYFPFERVMSPSTTLFVRTDGDPVLMLAGVRGAIHRLEAHAVVDGVRTLPDIAQESAAVTRLATRLLGGFAVMALLLAALGVYGVMSYRVRRRTRELGTRLALGASPTEIAWLVMRQTAGLMSAGLAAGTVAALLFTQTLTAVLFSIAPWDPVTFTSTAGLLAAVALAASYLPARRAARINPVVALASE
jgi:putative ABC transport system permease protein